MRDLSYLSEKLADIKDSWKVFEIFEKERAKLKQEAKQYDQDLQQNQELLARLRAQITECKHELKNLQEEILQKKETLNYLREKELKQQINMEMEDCAKQRQRIKQRSLLPKQLKIIEVFDEQGNIKKLKAVRRVYDSEMFNQYRITLKENRLFREKLMQYELENSQLKIELRDFFSEMALQERDKKINQAQPLQSLPEGSDTDSQN